MRDKMNKLLGTNLVYLKKFHRLQVYSSCQAIALYCFSRQHVSTQICNTIQQSRQYATQNRLLKKLSDSFNFMSDTSKLNIGACLCYEKCADDIDYNYFFNYLKLPDTFNSWFLCIQLHVWIVALVTISEKNGRIFRNRFIEEMWNDVEQRMEKLTEMKSSTKKKYLREFLNQFHAALISYDEGILEDDKTLAAAVWRVLFGFDPNTDPRMLETCVFYIRKQIQHIDSQNSEIIMTRGRITFLPLKDIVSEMERLDHV